MKANVMEFKQQPDDDPAEAGCPPEVLEVFRQRIASLDRGEGLTTDELRARLRARREGAALTNRPGVIR